MSDPTDGTAASGIGLAIMTGIEKVWQLWAYINSTRDMLANHITSGSHTASQIVSGVFDVARIPDLDGSKITSGNVPGAGAIVHALDFVAFDATNSRWQASADFQFSHSVQVSENTTTLGHFFAPNMVAVTSGFVAVFRNSDGRLGISTSSKRFKKSIRSWAPELQAVLALRLVEYVRRDSGEREIGLIAEELVELGLDWLVFNDPDGKPLGIHYERIALALLPVIQDHEARLAKLEQVNA